MTIPAGTATLPLTLDRNSPVPLYHQLSQQFAAAIEQGLLKPGDTIEREDLLAERLDISRPTLRRALIGLVAQGLLVRTRGVGTIVTPPSGRSDVAARGPGPATGGRRGRAWTQLRRLDPDHVDPRIAGELGLAERSRLIYVEQVLIVDGRAVSLRRSWLPQGLLNPLQHDLAAVPLRRILSEVGHPVVSERRTFVHRTADPAEQAALGIQASDKVFTVSGVSFDRKGAPVERTTDSYRREIDHDALLAAG